VNSSGTRSDSTTALRDQIMHGFTDRYYPDDRPVPRALPSSAEHGSMAAGTYQLSRRGESTFIRLFWTLLGVGAWLRRRSPSQDPGAC